MVTPRPVAAGTDMGSLSGAHVTFMLLVFVSHIGDPKVLNFFSFFTKKIERKERV